MLEVSLGLTALLTLLLAAFAWPVSELAPRDLPLAVAGPTEATGPLQSRLSEGGAFDVAVLADRQAAVEAIEGREVYGALVVSADGTELLTAPAASPTVAQLLGQAISAEATAAGAPPPTVTEVVPLPEDDPRGAVFGAGALPLVLGGIATAVLVALRVPGRSRQLLAVAGVAGFAGLSLTWLLHGWLGALEGSYWANAGVVALGIVAIALPMLGLRNVLGLPGLGLGAATMLLLGNPLSGIASAPELLPDGWSTLGQWLPPGAIGQALRSTAYFDGAATAWPLTILAGWVALGVVLLALPGRAPAVAH